MVFCQKSGRRAMEIKTLNAEYAAQDKDEKNERKASPYCRRHKARRNTLSRSPFLQFSSLHFTL